MIVAGTDPGRHGSTTFIDTERCIFWTYDMPISMIGVKQDRWEVNVPILHRHFDLHGPAISYIEDVWSLPSDGHVGAFQFGAAYSVAKAVSNIVAEKTVKVRPQKWKASFRLNAAKAESIDMAKKLIPSSTEMLRFKKDDGRAESLLIAFYGCLELQTRFSKKLECGGVNDEVILPTFSNASRPIIQWEPVKSG